MKKLNDSEKLALVSLVVGKQPTDFTPAGWATYIGAAMPSIMALTSKAPEQAVFNASKASIVSRFESHRQVDDNGIPYILTDDDVKTARSQDALWTRVLDSIKTEILPACYSAMPHAVEHYLSDKFVFTSSLSKTVSYFRDIGKPGNVWFEAPDSEAPFTSLHGQIKHELNAMMCLHADERTVLVLRESGDGKHVTEQVNLASLYREYGKQILARIQKTGEGTAYKFFVERMQAEVDLLNRAWDGKRTKAELNKGLHDLPTLYEDLDSRVHFYEQFYREDTGIVTFTNDPDVPAFNYFDLGVLKEGPTPAFNMFMQGVAPECRETLMAAIYGTFDARCHLNQWITLHGRGGDGKSSLLMAMAEYAGDSMYCALSTDSAKSEFGLEECVGKRLVMFPDIQSGLSVKSGIIHKLTGHDLISINRKNKPHISTHIDCILWMASNSAPDVNFSNQNEARRCVYIKMIEPPIEVQKQIYFTKEDGSFELDEEGNKINNGYPLKQKLIEEMPYILHKCKAAFEKKVAPPYSVIRLSHDERVTAVNNCMDYDDDSLTYYLLEAFEFTGNSEDRMAQPEITNVMNITLKSNNMPLLDNSLKRKMFRKIDEYFKCTQVKSHGIKYRLGIKPKE